MTLRNFVKQNRAKLEQSINNRPGMAFVPRTASCYCSKSGTDHYHAPKSLTLSEIEDWVRNDESLYNWARSEGVRL